MIYLQSIANQLLDTFTNLSRVAKSYILAANAQVRVDVSTGQLVKTNESRSSLSSKDKNPLKRKGTNDLNLEAIAPEELRDMMNDDITEEVQVPEIWLIPGYDLDLSPA